jgi:UDP-N-acetylmuramoyl-tripeptide--D-alanyl-D-alanine ligase
LAHQILDAGVSGILLFGSEIRVTYEILETHNSEHEFLRWTDDRSQLENWVAELVKPGDLVLLKASRSMALENLAEVITKTLEVR